MEQKNEQTTNSYPEKEGLKESNENGKEIVDGANETDQLEKFNDNVPDGGRDAYPEKQQGAEPSEGDKA
jgi:hypothetical protein